MTLQTTLDRESGELDVIAQINVQPYADAVGCPAEYRHRFAGRHYVEIREVTTLDGEPVTTEDHENDYLHELALDRLHP